MYWSTSTTEVFMVDVRLTFSSRPFSKARSCTLRFKFCLSACLLVFFCLFYPYHSLSQRLWTVTYGNFLLKMIYWQFDKHDKWLFFLVWNIFSTISIFDRKGHLISYCYLAATSEQNWITVKNQNVKFVQLTRIYTSFLPAQFSTWLHIKQNKTPCAYL